MVKPSPRLLNDCVIALRLCFIPLPVCFIIYLVLVIYAVPRLLRSGIAFPTYFGFYLLYPSLGGKVSNLQCVTNNPNNGLNNYSYYCRFNVNSSNIEQFVKERQLPAQDFKACGDIDINVSTRVKQYSPTPKWKPSDLEVGGQCYLREHSDLLLLVYSPKNQLAYMQESD